jgi:hypothetical protein
MAKESGSIVGSGKIFSLLHSVYTNRGVYLTYPESTGVCSPGSIDVKAFS